MRWGLSISVAAVIASVGSAGLACSFLPDPSTPDGLRAASKAVAADGMCRTINIGVNDRTSLGPATNLGNGRVMQVISEDTSHVLLGDCNTREATILRGTPTQVAETSCGPDHEFASLTGDDAMLSLAQGADLHALVDIATAAGAIEKNPLKTFFEFDIFFSEHGYNDDYAVTQKDRFDLLCGCAIFYPNSPGASS